MDVMIYIFVTHQAWSSKMNSFDFQYFNLGYAPSMVITDK
jgi:hypothetical protein